MDLRHELKHRITPSDALAIKSRLSLIATSDAHAKDGVYFIRSLYFDNINDKALREKLDGVPMEERTAYYVCAICCEFPDGREIIVRGECHGHIGFERDGNEGFGYDPLFLINGKAFGRYTAEEKDKISHRGNALRLLTKELEKII